MDDNNKQQIIDEYEGKKAYYDGLRDDICNIERAIADMKQNIKNTIDTQNRMKQSNYEIWTQLENKDITPKTTEKEPSITDILDSFK